MSIDVPGTELKEIIDESERFAEFLERELRDVANLATAHIGEVIVAQTMPAAASPDDLNVLVSMWRDRVSEAVLPRLETIVRAGIASQIAGINTALGAPALSIIDETLLTQVIVASAENRLVGIGDELWEAARQSLTQGVNAGESIPDLARRVRDAVDVTTPRATTIARTEVIGASNKSSLEVMRGTGLVAEKKWLATFDSRVRLSHIAAHNQIVPLNSTFQVGASTLDHPGDPHGEPGEIINCRCAMGYIVAEDGDDRGTTSLTDHVYDDVSMIAAARAHDGAMIALVPSQESIDALELEDGEPADQLHMTMFYLGKADDWGTESREALITALTTLNWPGTLTCNAFGLAHWNPGGEYPCWVLNIGGDDITDTRALIDDQLSSLGGDVTIPEIPNQHNPFAAHVCLTYTEDTSQDLIDELKKRLGRIDFDRVRVAFGGENVDISLRGTLSTKASAAPAAMETTVDWYVEKNHEDCSEDRPWAVVKESDGSVEGCHETRADAVAQIRALLKDESQTEEREDEPVEVSASLFQDGVSDVDRVLVEGIAVVEGSWTGDGRQFAPNSLQWPDLAEINVPLQWQKETTHGGMNDVTVNVGRLTELKRDGDKIRTKGYIDGGSEDGAEVIRRLKSGTLSGVSIVADDPEQAEVEFVYPDGCPDMETTAPEDMEEVESRCFFPDRMIFHSGRVRALTFVDTPAFVEAYLNLVETEETESIVDDVVVSQEYGTVSTNDVSSMYRQLPPLDMESPESVAAFIDAIEPLLAASHSIVIPDVPPADWFDEPKELPPFGAITVTDEGRVYGLLAPRNVAHRSYKNKRVTVPTGKVDYTRWMNRETIVQGGQRVMSGPITMDCGHASTDPRLSATASMDHYDNACSIVATVRIGENSDGVWIAGALLPGVTPSQVTRMLACQLSGDWRKHNDKPGWRELVGALLVPVPGFPTSARHSVRTDHGELVASTVPMTWQLSGDLPPSVETSTEEPVVAAKTDTEEHDASETTSDVDTETSDVDAESQVETESEIVVTTSTVDDFPSWEDVRRRLEIRAQTDELAKRLERELGIEIGG